MPWIMGRAETFVKEIENLERYPSLVIARHIDEVGVLHMQKVNERIQHHEQKRQDQVRQEEEKLAAKTERQLERANQKKI